MGDAPERIGDEDPVSACKVAADMLLGDLAVEVPAAFELSGDGESVTITMRHTPPRAA